MFETRNDDCTQPDLMDVPYEIKVWLFEYEIINHYVRRLKEGVDLYLSNIHDVKNDQS
jgi:hypothetical protein